MRGTYRGSGGGGGVEEGGKEREKKESKREGIKGKGGERVNSDDGKA